MKKRIVILISLFSINAFSNHEINLGDQVIPDEAHNGVGYVKSISSDGFFTVSKTGWIKPRKISRADVAVLTGCLEGVCIDDIVKAPDSRCDSRVKAINFSRRSVTIQSVLNREISNEKGSELCTDLKINYRRFDVSEVEVQ